MMQIHFKKHEPPKMVQIDFKKQIVTLNGMSEKRKQKLLLMLLSQFGIEFIWVLKI